MASWCCHESRHHGVRCDETNLKCGVMSQNRRRQASRTTTVTLNPVRCPKSAAFERNDGNDLFSVPLQTRPVRPQHERKI